MSIVQCGPSTYALEVRQEVAEFAEAMEAKLCKNDHKTGWRDQPIEAHIKLLKIEIMEFDVAHEFLGEAEAAKELVDVANFALIIRDKLLARLKDRTKAGLSKEQIADLQTRILERERYSRE